jgi:hypothetical protein
MTKPAASYPCRLGEDACSPHERSDMRDRPRDVANQDKLKQWKQLEKGRLPLE